MLSSRIFWVNAKDNQKARYRVCIYINFKLDILSYHVLLRLKNYSIQFALRQVSVETWLNVETVWSTFGLHFFCLIYATEWHKTNRIYPWNAKHYSTFHIIIFQYTSSSSLKKRPIGRWFVSLVGFLNRKFHFLLICKYVIIVKSQKLTVYHFFNETTDSIHKYNILSIFCKSYFQVLFYYFLP